MLQLRRRLRFPDNSLNLVNTVLMLRAQRFNSYRTSQRAVLCCENLARPAMRIWLDILKHRLGRDITEAHLVQNTMHKIIWIRRCDRLLLPFVVVVDRRRKR